MIRNNKKINQLDTACNYFKKHTGYYFKFKWEMAFQELTPRQGNLLILIINHGIKLSQIKKNDMADLGTLLKHRVAFFDNKDKQLKPNPGIFWKPDKSKIKYDKDYKSTDPNWRF